MVPNNNGNNLYNAVINGGTLFQDIAAGVIIQQLQMSGGTLNLNNPLTLNAGLLFSGGNIYNGTLNIAGSSTQSAGMGVFNTTLNNSGSYDLAFDAANAFNNSGGSIFNNSGTVTKSSGTGNLNFNLALANSGAVSSQAGTLSLSGGGSHSGRFDAANGAILALASNFSIASGSSFTGAGTIRLNNNTTTTFAPGSISNQGTIFVNSTGNYTDFFLTGDLSLTGGGKVTLSNAARIRGSGTLTNIDNIIQGEANNAGSGLGNNELTVVNRSGGLVDANVNGGVLNVDPGLSGGLTNQGTLRGSGGGILQLNGNGGGAFNNAGGTIAALAGSQVTLVNSASISGGTLTTVGTGLIHVLNSASLADLTNGGAFQVDNNTSLTLSGTIVNSGSLNVNSLGNYTDVIANSSVTLTGGGVVTLDNAARIRGSGTLFIGDANGGTQTIQGEANNSGSGLGNNELTVVNRSGGLVDANVTNGVLNVDPGTSGLTNQGLLRASNGGILQLNGNGGGSFTNQSVIAALDGSQVYLVNGVTLSGGTLSTQGSGIVRVINSATLDSLTNAGALVVDNNASATFTGTITDTGTILLNSAGNFTDLFIQGNVTLTGGSVLTLKNAARIRGNGTLFIGGANGEAFTIQGEANNSGSGLGNNELTIVNRSGGLVDANVNGGVLNVDPGANGGLTNQGTLRGSGGGILQLNGNGGGAFNNAGGTISALDGSQVTLVNSVSISGGTLTTVGTGLIHVLNSASLADLTNAGAFQVDNNTSLTLTGTITNSGLIDIKSLGNFTDLILNGNVTLNGGGTINLSDAARIRGSGILTNSDNVIHGYANNSGSGIGNNEIGIVNGANGTIDASVSGQTLNVDPSAADGLTNNGTLRVSNGGILQLNGNGGGGFTSNGTIDVAMSRINVINGGNLTLLSASKLSFQIGGLAQGTQYGYLNASGGNVGLGGQLIVSFANNFQSSITNSNTFTLATSGSAFTGNFTNVASGGRLAVSNASGSFLVNYSGNTLTLSNYQNSGFAAQQAQTTETTPIDSTAGPTPAAGNVASQSAAGSGSASASPNLTAKGRTTLVRTFAAPRARPVAPERPSQGKGKTLRVADSGQIRDLLNGAASNHNGRVLLDPAVIEKRRVDHSGPKLARFDRDHPAAVRPDPRAR